jgi:VIT1/CCC1 family predicted Fe2+/Mn2+ transporter
MELYLERLYVNSIMIHKILFGLMKVCKVLMSHTLNKIRNYTEKESKEIARQ